MINKYSQEELNQILLSKNLNEFYLAIVENRQELLTDEEYDEISRNKTFYGEAKDDTEDLLRKIENDEKLKKFAPDIIRVMYSLAQIRHLAILTITGEDVYDIGNAKFEDMKRNKIIHFDNLTTIYDETNARLRYFTPEEEPQLTQKTVLLDVDDASIIQAYEDAHIHQEESDDLTGDFFNEVKDKAYTLKRK